VDLERQKDAYILDPVAFAAGAFPNHLAYYDGERRYSYCQAHALAEALRGFLSDQGLRPGDRIAVLARNSVSYALLFFAALREGVSVVPLNIRWPAELWKYGIRVTGSRLILAQEQWLDAVQNFEVPVRELPAAETLAAVKQPGVQRISVEQEANVVFSSGSTGKPKAAVLPYRCHYFSAAGAEENMPLQAGDVWEASLPFYHVGGLAILYRCALAGAAALIRPQFEPEKTVHDIRKGILTHISVVAPMLARLLEAGLVREQAGRLKVILLGGGPASESLLEQCADRCLPVVTTYGLTECASQVTATSPGEGLESWQTAGKPLPYRKLRLMGTPVKLADGRTVQEIEVGGRVLFAGYLDEDGFRPAAEWLATGDLGYFTPDGNLVVVSRKDEMIISGGENLDPNFLRQQALLFPGVKDCAVLAISHNIWGQRPALILEVENCCGFPQKEFEAFLLERVGKIYYPDRILYLEQLPRVSISKVDRQKLRQMLDTGAKGCM